MRAMMVVMMFVGLSGATVRMVAQVPAGHAEVALDYTWTHSNAPPGGCGCFSLQGGSATVAVPLAAAPISFVADVTIASATPGTPGFYGSLRLDTVTAGARYTPLLHRSRAWQPFIDAQAGVAHAAGSLASPPYPASANASAAFAGSFGGGVDLRFGRYAALRVVDAEYVLTTFDNSSNNRQNNARVGAGLVLRF